MADVRLPNGVEIKNVPEGVTQQELMEKAIAGGFATEEDFSEFINTQQTPSESESPPQLINEPKQSRPIDKVLGGVSGATTIASETAGTALGGLTALVDQFNPFTKNDPEATIRNIQSMLRIEPTQEGQLALNELNELLSPLQPIIQSVEEFSKKAGQQGLDLTGSPAFATFVQILPQIASEVLGFRLGSKIPERTTQNTQSKAQADAELRRQQGIEEKTGIKSLSTDVAPPETRVGKFLQQQGELLNPRQRQRQQQQRELAVDKLIRNYDIEDGARYQEAIVNSIKEQVGQKKSAFGELYEKSSGELDQLGAVPLTNLKKFASEFIEKEKRLGSKADTSAIQDMQDILELPNDLTFEEVKRIRSSYGNTLQRVEKGAPVTGSTDTGFLKTIYRKLSSDLENFARVSDENLFNQWKQADKEFSSYLTSADKTNVKRAIRNGDATPELVDPLLFSNKESDIKFLSNNLTPSGKQAAKQRVLQMAYDRAIDTNTGDLSVNNFNRQIRKLDKQINAIFEPMEAKAIKELNTLLSQTRRAQDAAVTTPTGQSLLAFAAFAEPTVLSFGALQAALETKPIRNLLIRRAATKDAKKKITINEELATEMRKAGLLGASIPATISSQTQGENNGN